MMKEKDSKYRRGENDRDWLVLASVSLIETFRKLEFDCSCCFCYSKAHQEPASSEELLLANAIRVRLRREIDGIRAKYRESGTCPINHWYARGTPWLYTNF